MAWMPLHESHAIERVRILIQFEEPLPSRLLASYSKPILDNVAELAFDSFERVHDSNAIGIVIAPNARPRLTTPGSEKESGWVVRRLNDAQVVEELGLRSAVFGYVTTEYGRWANLFERLREVLFPPLGDALTVTEVASMRLEYWDVFVFDGEPDRASADSLFPHLTGHLPEHAAAGRSLWHVHDGWFEVDKSTPILVNRNVDLVDRVDADGKLRRAANIYTLAEARYEKKLSSMDALLEDLDALHKVSVTTFALTVNEDQLPRIGISIENYKS